jgi:hypothetical protein
MCILSISQYRWRISKGGKTVLSGIGTPSQALAIAKAHGLILSGIEKASYLKVA